VLDAGHLLDNRYRLDERIATGGMGDVWRGTDVVLNRVVAVKVLRAAMMSDPEFAARFYGEARMMAAFRHPGVVEVYDYASAADSTGEDQCAYLVMAYVEGEPLSTRLKEVGRLAVAETMSIVSQTADALHAAHQNGTVHRDVKPGNLIVKPTGAVILVDFGVARSNAVTSMTGINSIVGTALYMAPEQVAKGNVTPATDIYALGAVAYHCLAGHPPFDGDNALQVALRHLDEEPEPLPAEVPVAVRELISRAMAKHPEDRFASAAEFAEAALAATAPMDYRSQTGTALTAPLSPAALGAGQQLTAGPPTRTAPIPRDLPFVPQGPAKRKRTRGELAVLLTVIFLGLAAAGLATALIFQPDGNGNAVEPATTTSAEVSESAVSEAPAVPPGPSDDNTEPARPNGQSPQPTRTPSTRPPTSAPATSRPVTTAPPTEPTTEPTTDAPTEPGTTEPETPPADGEGGEDTGTGGA
jgi:serine/threonine-protein kinase